MLNIPTTAVARKSAYIYRRLLALATTNAPVATILEAGGVVCAKAYHIHRLTIERKIKHKNREGDWILIDVREGERSCLGRYLSLLFPPILPPGPQVL